MSLLWDDSVRNPAIAEVVERAGAVEGWDGLKRALLDVVEHAMTRTHGYDPGACEGCELTEDVHRILMTVKQRTIEASVEASAVGGGE